MDSTLLGRKRLKPTKMTKEEVIKIIKFMCILLLNIILLFTFMFGMSYASTSLRSNGFFADVASATHDSVDPNWDWGTRHYTFIWFWTILAILMIASIIIWSISYWIDESNA